MPSPRPSGLRLRLLALVALLVVFDAAFVVATYWFAHLAVGIGIGLFTYELSHLAFAALRFETLPSLPVVAVGTVLTLALQSVFGYRASIQTAPGETQPLEELLSRPDSGQPFGGLLADRSHAVSDDADEGGRDERVVPTFDYSEYRERVAARLTGLAQLSDTPIPDVRVVDSETPNSYVAGRPGQQTLVVTTGLLRTLDDEALDAVLAHELAHLKHGDAFVMTAAGFLPTITGRLLDGTVGFLRRSKIVTFLAPVEPSEDGEMQMGDPRMHVAMLGLVPVVLTISGTIWLASTACYRSLSRLREFRADAGAAAIEGSPAALAGALETLEDHRPKTDLRAAETGVRELCVLPDAIDDADEIEADDALARTRRRCRSLAGRLLPASHPPVERRIDALRERERSGPER